MSYSDMKSRIDGLLSLEPAHVAAAHKGATWQVGCVDDWLAPRHVWTVRLLPGWGRQRGKGRGAGR
jgi:hypothetical protein